MNRAAFWRVAAERAEADVARWTARGECPLTRGAVGRAMAWERLVRQQAEHWGVREGRP